MDENITLEQNANAPKPLDKMKTGFRIYGGIAVLYGIFFVLCRYKNPSGIAVVPAAMSGYAAIIAYLKYTNIKLKPGSLYIICIAFLIAITSCRTLDEWIIFANDKILFLIFCVFILHQNYDDKMWNIGKYLSSIVIFIFSAAGTVFAPIIHLMYYLKNTKNIKYLKVIYVFMGLLIALPLIFIMAFMLSTADAVFADLIKNILITWFRPQTVLSVTAQIILYTWLIYCFMCSMCLKNIKESTSDRRNLEPIVAITCMGTVSILYVLFCAIQIIYLFMGKGTLPDGVTYSSYAHEGFFQLLFVAFANLILVLCCVKFFRKNIILKLTLSLISICTYIMIASAGKRMLLYIGEYNLTFLRIFVLWFLMVLAILMLGVMVIIYKNNFPLFGYSFVVISVSYLCFAWAKPDRIIAEYNINSAAQKEITESEMSYLAYDLSDDAAPILWDVLCDSIYKNKKIKLSDEALNILQNWSTYKESNIENISKNIQSVRKYNFSAASMIESYESYIEFNLKKRGNHE